MITEITRFADDNYWSDLAQASGQADVRLRFTVTKNGPPRAFLTFCGQAQSWVMRQAERFDVQLGSDAAAVRLVPNTNGAFKRFVNGKAIQVGLRNVPAWPVKERAYIDCDWMIELVSGGMVVTLPKDFVGGEQQVEVQVTRGADPDEVMRALRLKPAPVREPDALADGYEHLKRSVQAAAKPAAPVPTSEKRPADPILRTTAPDRLPASKPAVPTVASKLAASAPPLTKAERLAGQRHAVEGRVSPAGAAPAPSAAPARRIPVVGEPEPGRSALDRRRAEQGA